MAEINRTLRELWRSTYKGKDIEYIEILTEAEPTGSAETGAALRRNKFNYRVVCFELFLPKISKFSS